MPQNQKHPAKSLMIFPRLWQDVFLKFQSCPNNFPLGAAH